MASPELEKVLARMAEQRAAQADEPPPDLATMRRGSDEQAFPATDAATIQAVSANGVPGEWVTVAGSNPAHRILYFHGGGYVIGSALMRRRLGEDLAQATGCAVLNLDYRMGPEDPFPAAVEDAVTALGFIQANGPDGESPAEAVFVGGDSAGGGLTLSTLVAARDRSLPLPDAAFGISSWTDLAATGKSLQTRIDVDPIITDLDMLTGFADHYLQGQDARDPLASPLYADLSGLPPLLLQVGDHEVLLDDTTRVAAKAREAGVEVVEEVWPEMFHVWHGVAPILPEGQEAIEHIGEFVRARIGAAVSGD